VIVSAQTAMAGSYDYRTVTLSALMALAASYAALDLAGRVTAASSWVRSAWLIGGASAMGLGIWSMHFIAMLAFSLPVPISYHLPTVLLSLIAGIFSSTVALHVVSKEKMSFAEAVVGGSIMGMAIAGMHYIGMAAMRLAAAVRFDPRIVTLSVVIAIVSSVIALLLAFDLREETRETTPRKSTFPQEPLYSRDKTRIRAGCSSRASIANEAPLPSSRMFNPEKPYGRN